MDKINVKFADQCYEIKVAKLILTEWLRYIEEFSIEEDCIPDFNKCNLVWVEKNGEPVSVCLYYIFGRYAWIYFGATKPEYRRKGFYSLLIDNLIENLKTNPNVKSIRGGVRATNTAMMDVACKQGRKILSNTWEKRI